MADKQFAVCVDNADYPAALEVRKVYQVLPDADAASRSYLRIIDESGEDYLYPGRMFLQIRVRPEGQARLVKVLRFSRKRPVNSSRSRKRRTTNNGRARRPGSSKRGKPTSA